MSLLIASSKYFLAVTFNFLRTCFIKLGSKRNVIMILYKSEKYNFCTDVIIATFLTVCKVVFLSSLNQSINNQTVMTSLMIAEIYK